MFTLTVLASCLVLMKSYYHGNAIITFNKQVINTEEVPEGFKLRVLDLITEDKVYIEACDNVTEPSDNKREAESGTNCHQ